MSILQQHRFTVDDLHRMTRAGILDEDDRVELIDGQIVEMSPIGTKHMAVVNWLNHWFSQALGKRAIVHVQNCLRLGAHSLPQPDVVLLQWRDDFYRQHEPGAADTLLVIEVCDTSLHRDQQKLGMYASGGIGEVWLVDLDTDTLHVHRRPQGDRYAEVSEHRPGEQISPQAFSDLTLDLEQLFAGPRK